MRILSIGVVPRLDTVEIAITDTGIGIAAAEIANLFDPFFTTKPAGKGLGLGLAISFGLVRDSGGTITVKSRPGQGSTFTISLSQATTAAARASA